MLKKLFKHDMIALSKMLGLFSCIALAAGGIGVIAIRLLGSATGKYADNQVLSAAFGLFGGLLVFIAVMTLIAYFVVSLFMIARRFYTHFFTDEGYLTFTLPVTQTQLLVSKYLTACIWILITLLTLFCSVLLMILFGPPTIPDLSTIPEILAYYGFESASMASLFAMLVVDVIVDMFCIFLAISLGCMIAKKHKILASVGLYYVVQMGVSTLSLPFSIVSGVMSMQGNENAYLFSSLGGIFIEILVACLAFFFTRLILKKRINLN